MDAPDPPAGGSGLVDGSERVGLASSLFVPYAAYLRVYEPLAAFPEPERSHWYRYAGRADPPTAQDELRRSLVDLLPTPPVAVPVHESGDAFVAVVDGVTCVCPWRTRLRGWEALEALPELLPAPVLDAALPQVVRRQAADDHERWRERNPDARPWIRTATWHVPVRWFALFTAGEREYVQRSGEGEKAERPVLRYRTPMVEARRRVARGLRVLREALNESPLIDGLEDVGRWLEEFHPRSLVELDYGGLVHALTDDWLAGDRSAADVTEGLEALRAGDGVRAGEVYQRLVERWRAVREREFAS
nr:ORF1 [Streptomyces fradiae]